MSFTFPQDSVGRGGAVRATADGNNFFVPTVLYGPDGVTPVSTSNGVTMSSVQQKWKDSFAGTTLNSAKWTVVQTGAGMTVDPSTAGQLKIQGGTSANSETIIRSTAVFTIPVRALFILAISQRISNQDVAVEFISVDPNTLQSDGQNLAQWRISNDDSATAGYAVVGTTVGGLAVSNSAAFSTGLTATSQNIYEIEMDADEIWFHTRVADSVNGRAASNVKNTNIPDPNGLYTVQLRVKNKTTAPASNTTVTFEGVTIVDYNELTAEIVAGRGNGAAGQALPVQVLNAPNVGTLTTLTTGYMAPKSSQGTITTTAIATATPFTQTALDAGSPLLYKTMRCRFIFDQPVQVDFYSGSSATLTSNKIQQTTQIAANTPTVIDYPLLARYCGVKITNTGAATTTVQEALYSLFGL